MRILPIKNKTHFGKILLSLVVVFSIIPIANAAIYQWVDGRCDPGENTRFPWNYTCSWNGDDYTNASLTSTSSSTPLGSTRANPKIVPAGSTLDLEFGFDTNPSNVRVANTDGSASTSTAVHAFVTVDIREDYMENGGSISPGTGSTWACPGTLRDSNNPSAGRYPILTAIGESPYAPANNAGDNSIDCGDEGRLILWTDVNKDDPGPFKFSINLGTFTPSGSDTFCIRGNLAVAPSNMTVMGLNNSDPSDDFQALKRLVKKTTPNMCYQIRPVTIKGYARSVIGDATGKGLPFVNMQLDRGCNTGIDKEQLTASGNATSGDTAGWEKGEYRFRVTQGEFVCINAPPDLVPPANGPVEGTTYSLLPRQYQHGGRTDSINYINQVVSVNCDATIEGYCSNNVVRSWDIDDSASSGSTVDHNYNFTYGPIPGRISLSKAVNVGDGTNVKPGDRLDYTVTASNPYDNNMAGVNIEDMIPKNIDPSSAVIDSITIATNLCDPNRPGYSAPCNASYGWQVGPVNNLPGSACTGAAQLIPYGWVGTSNVYPGATFSCGKDFQSNRDRIFLNFSRMPAYTQAIIRWHGNVKAADQVDVYPANNVCPSSGTCVDRNIGSLQAVINNVRTDTSGVVGYGFSTPTITNPIPGDVTSVAKSVDGFTELGGQEAYSLDDDEFNGADFTSRVNFDNSKGPIWYQLIDQTNGDNTNYGGAQLDSRIIDGSVTTVPNANFSGRIITWPEVKSTDSFDDQFSFRTRFNDIGAVGTYAYNTSKACWRQYWLPNHDITCRPSNQAQILKLRVDKPTVAADFGGVTGGGSFRITNETACPSNNFTNDPRLRGSIGSYGMYMLNVEDPSGYNLFGSKSGFSVDNLSKGGGVKCRPDLFKTADSYSPSENYASDSISGDQNYTGKIIRRTSPAGFTIGQMQVRGRWTIVVDGPVYIRGNITTPGGTANLSEQNSLGIIATEGIFIDKNVSRVDAMLYAGTRREPSGNYSRGEINTCASTDSYGLVQGSPGGPGYSAAQCREQNLTINGVMYARTLRLNRTKVSVNVNSDKVVLPGSAYLFSPPLFNYLFNTSGSNIRETRPRF